MSAPHTPFPALTMSRRIFMVTAGFAVLNGGMPGPAARAATSIGSLVQMRGDVKLTQNNVPRAAQAGLPLDNNDLIATGVDGFAELQLGTDTRILMGAETQILIDNFLAEQGGTLELVSGQMVFDRPEGLPKIDLTLRTTFGQIGVRGTKFFCGVNRGNYAVFVEHGLVEVTAGETAKPVGAGEGVDIAHDNSTRSLFGGDISPIKKWGKGRIAEAYESVGLSVD